MYPWPTLYALPLSRRPGVLVPTIVARLFSSAKAETISPDLVTYLKSIRFAAVWEKLQQNFPDEKNLLSGFHSWFDGLKTMKLIHHLCAGPLPRCEPDKGLPELFRWAGLEPFTNMQQQLALLRQVQIGGDYNLPQYMELL